jgi:hypothetical protein
MKFFPHQIQRQQGSQIFFQSTVNRGSILVSPLRVAVHDFLAGLVSHHALVVEDDFGTCRLTAVASVGRERP